MASICITLSRHHNPLLLPTAGLRLPLRASSFRASSFRVNKPLGQDLSELGYGASVKPSWISNQLHKSAREEKLDVVKVSVKEVGDSEVEIVEGGGGGDDISDGNGGGGGGDDENDEEGGDEKKKKAANMSMSQKLSLAYGALLAVGGVIGYAKSRSTKSLLFGTLSALTLYYVSTQLPVNPVYASSLGLGVSSLLLIVMGTRFKKSGKLFPAGVVSIVSLIMTGGYLHGIMRSTHHA